MFVVHHDCAPWHVLCVGVIYTSLGVHNVHCWLISSLACRDVVGWRGSFCYPSFPVCCLCYPPLTHLPYLSFSSCHFYPLSFDPTIPRSFSLNPLSLLRVLCSTCSESEHLSFNLLHLLDDLTHYFHLPPPPLTSLPPLSHTSHPPQVPPSTSSQTYDSWQAKLCLLRERQELFQKQGMLQFTLNVIIETGQKCRTRYCEVGIRIHHNLYALLTAMIRGNRKNCSAFATGKWLKVFIDQLNIPLFTHDVLEVIQCLLTDSPEVLNIITKEHIQVSLLPLRDTDAEFKHSAY